jgi:hypothetical protein
MHIPTFLLRFKSRLDVDPEKGCIVWTGRKDRDGYALFRENGVDVRAHRWSWEQSHGKAVPRRRLVRHTCHRRSCVNPDHLRIGTAQQNVRDRQAADRQAKGSRNGRAKATEGQVAEAIKLIAEGTLTVDQAARLLGVKPAAVSAMRTGRTWKHVNRG